MIEREMSIAKPSRYLMFVVLTFCLVQPGVAQNAPCYDRAMVPVIARNAPGAHGSIWQTRLTITNHSTVPVDVVGYGSCDLSPCAPPLPIAADSSVLPPVFTPYIEVECGRMTDVTMQLRVQDLSRQSETWGTTIPIVTEEDLFENQTISLTAIPNTPEFRSMLRVYGFDPGVEGIVRVSIFALDESRIEGGGSEADELLLELSLALTADASAPMHTPVSASVPLWTIPELEGQGLLRVEVAPEPSLRLWSFVSATNNQTQHVTVLLP